MLLNQKAFGACRKRDLSFACQLKCAPLPFWQRAGRYAAVHLIKINFYFSV